MQYRVFASYGSSSFCFENLVSLYPYELFRIVYIRHCIQFVYTCMLILHKYLNIHIHLLTLNHRPTNSSILHQSATTAQCFIHVLFIFPVFLFFFVLAQHLLKQPLIYFCRLFFIYFNVYVNMCLR